MKSARYIIYELLMKGEKGAYSNISLGNALSDKNISGENRRFVSRIFYGVIERKLTLDHIISQYSRKPAQKLDREVLTALRMGIYQLLYCDGIPDSAAVSESVDIVKQAGKGSAAGYVNGVLREFIRRGKKYTLPEDKTSALSVEYSCNEDIVKLLIDSIGEEETVCFLKNSFSAGGMTARVNTLKISAAELKAALEKDGFSVETADLPLLREYALKINAGGAPDRAEAYRKGYFHIQDISSQLCCAAVDPSENDTVIDVCAAPGGKTFTMAEMMNGRGKLLSCELHENRLGLIKQGAERLGLSDISVICRDGKVFDPDMTEADKVLCDVPCSGLGVIGGKPEIKYKSVSDLARLPDIQYDILKNSARYVRRGGTLVYSTCTLNKAENSEVTERFLKENQDFYGVPFLTELGEPFGGYSAAVLPRHFGSDGFYICKMKKK